MFLNNIFYIIKSISKYLKQNKLIIICLYIISIMSNMCTLIPIYIFGKSVDYIVSKNLKYVEKMIFMMIIIFIINTLLSVIETYISVKLNNKMLQEIKVDLFTKIITANVNEFEILSPGEYISRIEGDISAVIKFITNDLCQLILYIINVIVSLYFILTISFKLSMVAIIVLPLNYIISSHIGNILSKNTVEGKKLNDNYYSFLYESLVSFKEIKCLNVYANIIRKYSSYIEKIIKNSFNISMITMLSSLFNLTISAVSKWIIIIYAAFEIMHNRLSVGLYVAFNSYLDKFTSSVDSILSFGINSKAVRVSSDRIMWLQGISSEEIDKIQDEIILDCGKLGLRDVKFKYRKSDRNIIDGLSMEFEQNSLNAIVGFSGCGKSTILNLICGLYRTDSGSIYIDGTDIDEIGSDTLRKNISYIQQEPFIFTGTILDNFKILDKNITEEDIKNACKMANIDDYIEKLPEKYLTLIGKDGIQLSAGQKQRMAIARAILKNSKILILDEVTSNLDACSEMYIMKTLSYLSKTRMIIIVAHRITTILNIPNIYVINKGKLEDKGNHSYLINNCKAYKMIYEEQWESMLQNENV